jgi:hypothetical protein
VLRPLVAKYGRWRSVLRIRKEFGSAQEKFVNVDYVYVRSIDKSTVLLS